MIEKVGLKGKVTLEEYTAAYDALLPELLPNCRMMPGAMRFVQHLARHNIPFAICTGSRSMECDLKLRNLKQLTDLVPLMVRGEDPEIRNGKPAPDCFLVTMNRFKEKPESAANVAVFEDSPNGIRAAVRAGMRAVMIPDVRYASPPEDIKDRITMVLGSFEEFLPESLGLPPYNDGNSNS
uniref:Haloacid dehalogenase-like hydrolase domain-containing protein 1 n=1 Tax=Ascaris suum TaxID=6253 RepID=F1L8D5_ASCSU